MDSGQIVQIVGAVVDVEFPREHIPQIYDALNGGVNAVFAEAELGEVGIYPQHAPFLSTLRPGEVRVRIEG